MTDLLLEPQPDDETAKSTTDLSQDSFSLRIKSSAMFQDVFVTVTPETTIQECKSLVRTELGGGDYETRYLRLISHGRLLAPDTSTLGAFQLKHQDVVHAVFAAAGVRGGQQALLARGMSNSSGGNAHRRYRGTGLNSQGRAVRSSGAWSDEDEHDGDQSDGTDDEEQGRERLGFDRLRLSGMSRLEISAVRSYFSRHVDRYATEHPEALSDANTTDSEATTSNAEDPTNDPARRRLLYEDAWMQAQGPLSEFRLNLNQNLSTSLWTGARGDTTAPPSPLLATRMGTDRDFMFGILLGFFVGYFMLLWVWMPTVPHKQKLGILTGISIQLVLTLLRNEEEVPVDLDE